MVIVSDVASDRAEIHQRQRQIQARLHELVDGPLMRGSIVERVRRCGRPNCACASDPAARHGGKFLTVSLNGKTEALHVRPEDEPAVREAIEAYGRLWNLLNKLTACALSELRLAIRERRRAHKARK